MSDALKTALGWACFHIWTRIPSSDVQCDSRLGLWLLSWAGYYAFAPERK